MTGYHHGNLREALIARAIDVIGKKGVEGLSLRGVAKDIGVSHAAPARHFKNKNHLLTEIVRDSYDQLTQAVLAQTEDDTDPVERLAQMVRSALTWALSNKARFSVMTNPDVSRFADDALKNALQQFVKSIEDAQSHAKGQDFQLDVTPQGMLIYALGATLGVATLLTDDLMRIVTGANDDPHTIDELSALIIPRV